MGAAMSRIAVLALRRIAPAAGRFGEDRETLRPRPAAPDPRLFAARFAESAASAQRGGEGGDALGLVA